MTLRHLLLCTGLILLTGCSHLKPTETLENNANKSGWLSHKAAVSQINSWQIDGKIGIRSQLNGRQESGSATLFWLQRQDYYDIRLAGPLGRGAARITGREGQVELEVANHGRFQASSAEALLAEHLDWQLPVAQLLWWVRGLPEPSIPSVIKLNDQGRLAQLSQGPWHVEYLNYADYAGNWLPQRLKIKGPNIDITLVIKDWHPRQLGL